MSISTRIVRVFAVLATFVALTACTATFRNHGYAPTDLQLAEVLVGVDTRETVATSVGTPGTAGLLNSSGWYYVQSRFRHFAYNKPEEIERQVVAISFAEDGVVSNVERFGLEDGQIVTLSRRVTDSNIKGISFVRQLFGNLGRVNLADAL
ncbi:outer membrane protein assembly factor BamE [Aliiroseovarius subalbicans]|uniref:outer membrane protein assembly factor BamE n=1 Tax=Aliiroseovarius subalbicans TaxID=2925840 RepID=UPI001F5A5578|nr:outer membrane protein assembly factor BamE [Aliiroseovarius subalbicans]MCI2398735.1 outer membrane protein assembly factor BamE [Aliiroseovarius subalbicans]